MNQKKSISLSLDWLSFTFEADKARSEYLRVFGKENQDLLPDDISLFFATFPEFEALKSDFLILNAKSHYENVLGFLGVSETCRISYNSPDYTNTTEMGVNVSIPSHGLEWFFELMGVDFEEPDAVQEMFKILKDRYCHCSRIDLAFDDYSKKFRAKQYVIWWWNNNIRTRFKTMKTSSCSMHDEGHTFYLGSRLTGKMLRIYDKDVESNGAIDAVRYEFELHVKYARDMFEYLIEHKTVDFISYLRSFFDVIERNDSNISRCSLLPEWEEWLSKLDFSEELPEKTEIPHYSSDQRKFDTTYWLLNNCLRSIKGFVECFGWDCLHDYVRQDNRPIPEKYRLLLDTVQKDGLNECKYNF